LHLRTKLSTDRPNQIHKLLTEVDLKNLNTAGKATATPANNRFKKLRAKCFHFLHHFLLNLVRADGGSAGNIAISQTRKPLCAML